MLADVYVSRLKIGLLRMDVDGCGNGDRDVGEVDCVLYLCSRWCAAASMDQWQRCDTRIGAAIRLSERPV